MKVEFFDTETSVFFLSFSEYVKFCYEKKSSFAGGNIRWTRSIGPRIGDMISTIQKRWFFDVQPNKISYIRIRRSKNSICRKHSLQKEVQHTIHWTYIKSRSPVSLHLIMINFQHSWQSQAPNNFLRYKREPNLARVQECQRNWTTPFRLVSIMIVVIIEDIQNDV